MYEIPSLAYKYGDLEPYIDEATMRVHHTKHHQAYTDKLNAALENHADLQEKDLATLIWQAETILPENIRAAVINNGGGFLNHNLWWSILHKPQDENNTPAGTSLGVMIDEQFGSYDDFKTKFKEQALGLFGGGWTWLCVSNGKLEIVNTANQNILPAEKKVVVGLDVWEHAYYLKYQNRRAEYIDAFFHVIDWKKVDQQLKIEQKAV